MRVFCTSIIFQKLSKTLKNSQKLSKTFKNSQKFSKTLNRSQKISKTALLFYQRLYKKVLKVKVVENFFFVQKNVLFHSLQCGLIFLFFNAHSACEGKKQNIFSLNCPFVELFLVIFNLFSFFGSGLDRGRLPLE